MLTRVVQEVVYRRIYSGVRCFYFYKNAKSGRPCRFFLSPNYNADENDHHEGSIRFQYSSNFREINTILPITRQYCNFLLKCLRTIRAFGNIASDITTSTFMYRKHFLLTKSEEGHAIIA